MYRYSAALSLPSAGGIAAGEQSDHLTYAAAYEGWAKAAAAAVVGGVYSC